MIADHTEFPFLAPLVAGWQDIKDEMEALDQSSFIDWPERHLYDGSWTVLPLYKFGTKVQELAARCPKTTSLVEAIPGMLTAGFSALAPGTHIGPHLGYTNEVLRCHLGLLTPPNCAIRVGGTTRPWEAGDCFVFDDTYEHEAWNRGDQRRVVLLLDFKRDPDADVKFPDAAYDF
jgi:beta-hydroxylase